MSPTLRFWSLVAAIASVATAPAAEAQMRVVARYDGVMRPVVDCSKQYLYVLRNGWHEKTGFGDYRVEPASAFGPGFVAITHLKVDLDPLRNATAAEKTKPTSVGFRFHADVTADRDLKHCYALLTFAANGSVGTWFYHLGKLRKGSPRHVDIAFRDHVDTVGALHVFSEGLEIASSELPKAYDIRQAYAALGRTSPGISALELVTLGKPLPHALSDDGRFLATARDRSDYEALVVYDLRANKRVVDLKADTSLDRFSDLTWVSDHELAYLVGFEIRGIFLEKLKLLDVNTGKAEEIPMRSTVVGIVEAVHNRPGVVVLLQYRSRFGEWSSRYDLHARKSLDRDDLEGGYAMFDKAGEARVHYVYDGDTRKYDMRPKNGGTWKRMDACVKEPGLHFNVRGRDLLDRVTDILALGADGDTVYIASRLHSDVFRLAAYSLSGGVIKKVIASVPHYDLTDEDSGGARLLFRKGTSEVIGMIYNAQKPTVVWFDPDFKTAQAAVDRALGDHVNLPLDWSEGGRTMIYYSFSDRDPGTYYVFRPAQGVLMSLLQLTKRLKGKPMGSTVPLDFTARDGATIHAYVTYPPGPRNGPLPLVVDVHGGPTARDDWEFSAENQFLATRGYLVLQVNYRGSSGYGAAYQKAGLKARLDTVIINDIADGARYLIRRGEADPNRVAIVGASFGGWAVYMSLIRYPHLYCAGVAISAISHWRTTLRNDRWKFRNTFAYSFEKTLVDSRNFAREEPWIDPYLRQKEITQPLLIMHGRRDTRVDVEETELMVKALRKHDTQVEAVYFPNAGHTDNEWSTDDKVRRLNEMAAFLGKFLAAGAPVPTSHPATADTPASASASRHRKA